MAGSEPTEKPEENPVRQPVFPKFATLLAALVAGAAILFAPAPSRADDDPWPSIRKDLFGGRDVAVNEGMVLLEAPARAEDAAVTPVTIRVPAQFAAAAKSVTLIVDKNPAPVAATFAFGPAAGEGERMLATRIRVDTYSNVRAVLETADGKLHMMSSYVKAAGGCSAPALKDTDAALAELGQTRVKTFARAKTPASPREAQVMIRHPNYTGMQMNQITRDYTPAMFVEEIEVKRDGELVFRMTGGISISENPNILFTYAGEEGAVLDVTARDTSGRVFQGRSSGGGS